MFAAIAGFGVLKLCTWGWALFAFVLAAPILLLGNYLAAWCAMRRSTTYATDDAAAVLCVKLTRKGSWKVSGHTKLEDSGDAAKSLRLAVLRSLLPVARENHVTVILTAAGGALEKMYREDFCEAQGGTIDDEGQCVAQGDALAPIPLLHLGHGVGGTRMSWTPRPAEETPSRPAKN